VQPLEGMRNKRPHNPEPRTDEKGTAVLWRRACEETEARLASFGIVLQDPLYHTLFSQEPGTIGEELLEDGAAVLPSNGAEVIILAERAYGSVGGTEDLVEARIFFGGSWKIELSGRRLAHIADEIEKINKLTVTVMRCAPEKIPQDPLLLSDEDWLENDPPDEHLAGGITLEFHEGKACLTKAIHYSGGVQWSPSPSCAAETAYFADGRVFWQMRQVNGRATSRGGLPSFEAFWPDGRQLVTEYTNEHGELHRNPQHGPAYQEWHPDGTLALEIYAESGRVVDNPAGGGGVKVGRAGQAIEPRLTNRRVDKKSGGLQSAPRCYDVLENQWRSHQENGRTFITGKPDMLLRNSHHQPWRFKKFFARHPESTLQFPPEAAWLTGPKCELHYSKVREGPTPADPKGSVSLPKPSILLQRGGQDTSATRSRLTH